MRLTEFMHKYRGEIDRAIDEAMYRHDGNGGRGIIPVPAPTHNDKERREWILNDEGLYRWARFEGVRI